jgi:hypothetical protein
MVAKDRKEYLKDYFEKRKDMRIYYEDWRRLDDLKKDFKMSSMADIIKHILDNIEVKNE